MKCDMFSEIRDGLLEKFRDIRKGGGDMKEKRKNADCLANIAGKITNTYRVEAMIEERIGQLEGEKK